MVRSDYLYILRTIPNFLDQMQYLQKHKTIADFPLFIRFENSIKTSNYYNYYRKGYRQTSKNLVSPCAYVNVFEDGIEIVLRYPRLVCQYMPHKKCPFDNSQATILLLNHEFMHAVLEAFDTDEGDLAFMEWDNITKLMNEILPETYCQC